MTPGPTRVPERVRQAGGRPMLHHRSAQFSRELATLLELLGPLFGSRNVALPVHATGRGAMEATICNLFSAGDEIAVCCNGKFGELWARLAESFGIIVHRAARAWDTDIDTVEIERIVAEHPGIRAVALTHCDTSTGVLNNVETISQIAKRHGALLLVDAVSAIGGIPFAFDEWGVDVAVTASQKCLMSSPGLSFAILSDRAWAAVPHARLPRSYWDFLEIRQAVTRPRPETPGTAPVHLVLQVAEALRMIHAEGLPAVYARHEGMGSVIRRDIARLGVALQCPNLKHFSPTLTAITLPSRTTPADVRETMKARGIQIAAALGDFGASAIRVGHMGDIRLADVELTLAVFGEAITAAPASTGNSRR